MDWNEFAREVHQNAVEHGWWDEPLTFGDIVSLCHSEISEALEEFRAGRPLVYFVETNGFVVTAMDERQGEKPEGIAVELGDCVMRILDWMSQESVDVDGAMAQARVMLRGGREVPALRVNGGMGDLAAELHLFLSLAYRNYLNGTGLFPIAVRTAMCILRIQEWAEKNGVDLDAVLEEKLTYNKTRSYRHGGKAL